MRDLLLGRVVKDLDVALEGDPVTSGRRLAEALGGSFVMLHEETSTVRVVVQSAEDWLWIDIVPLPETLEKDLLRRDFTINAMALPLRAGEWSAKELIDPSGGLVDLVQKRIRQTSPHAIPSDPLRMLRAFRLASSLKFEIEPETLSSIKEHALLIRNVSPERIRDEVFSLLETSQASHGLAAMDRSGLLTILFPELIPLHDCTQNRNHHLDVWDHTLEAIRQMDNPDMEMAFGKHVEPLLTPYLSEPITRPRSRRALIKFALIFHDVTKPDVRTDEDGRIKFIGHDQSSAEIAARIARKLRLSSREVRMIKLMVAYHLRPGFMAHQAPLTRRTVFRFFRDLGDAAPEALVLSYADRMAARGPATIPQYFEAHKALVTKLLWEYFKEEKHKVVPLINGSEIIEKLGIEPGPRVKRLLDELIEAQAAGEVHTRDEAWELLRRITA